VKGQRPRPGVTHGRTANDDPVRTSNIGQGQTRVGRREETTRNRSHCTTVHCRLGGHPLMVDTTMHKNLHRRRNHDSCIVDRRTTHQPEPSRDETRQHPSSLNNLYSSKNVRGQRYIHRPCCTLLDDQSKAGKKVSHPKSQQSRSGHPLQLLGDGGRRRDVRNLEKRDHVRSRCVTLRQPYL
jgi:hypothetical protein